MVNIYIFRGDKAWNLFVERHIKLFLLAEEDNILKPKSTLPLTLKLRIELSRKE